MTPLEHAARALYERDGTIFPIVPPGPLMPWGDLTEESKTPWINEARAVLTAIREPSEGIDTALVKFAGDMRFTRHDGTTFGVSELFRAGIDAALSEGEGDAKVYPSDTIHSYEGELPSGPITWGKPKAEGE